MQHRDYIIIKKILSEVEIGIGIIGNTSKEDFLADEKMKRAICMTAINIGELVKNITDDTRKKYSHVEWKPMAGMRDMAAHKYLTLRMEDVFGVAKEDFPVLKSQLLDILEKEIDEHI